VPSTCVFCRIVAGEQPAHVVLDDEVCLAFLDVRPVFPGHVLLVPKAHHETLPDLPVDLVGGLFERARRLAAAVPAALDATGTFVAVNNTVSQSVPHLHVHVVPRRPKDGLKGFFWPRHPYDDDAHMGSVAAAIRDALSSTSADPE
jgi:histidine triad (HIT) family protein